MRASKHSLRREEKRLIIVLGSVQHFLTLKVTKNVFLKGNENTMKILWTTQTVLYLGTSVKISLQKQNKIFFLTG